MNYINTNRLEEKLLNNNLETLHKLDILHISGDFFGGGGEMVSFQTVKLLSEEKDLKVGFAASLSREGKIIASSLPGEVVKFDLKRCKPKQNSVVGLINYVYSIPNYQKIKYILEKHKPKIIHIQNFLNLSTSVLKILREYKRFSPESKIVETVHGFYFGCPNSSLFDYRENSVCEKCLGSSWKLPILFNNCYSNLPVSLAKWIRSFFQHILFSHNTLVDLFLSPSDFLRFKLLQEGIPDKRIQILHNPVVTGENDFNQLCFESKEKHFTFVGRLSKEKNISTLVRGFLLFKNKNDLTNDFSLSIIGDGPEKKSITKLISDTNFPLSTVTLTGSLDHQKVIQQLGKSMFIVLPSKWYENSPLALVEGIMCGCFPIASEIGGMKEIIEDSLFGETFNPLSEESVALAFERATNKVFLIPEQKFRENSLHFQKKHHPDKYKERLLEIYSSL